MFGCLALTVTPIEAETRLFLSSKSLGQEASPGNPVIDHRVGESGSLFLWVRTSTRLAGISVELSSAEPSVRFNDIEVFQFRSANGENRWTFTDTMISGDRSTAHFDGGCFCVGLAGYGMGGPASEAADQGFEPGTGFLFARVDYEAIARGKSELVLRIGNNLMSEVRPPIFFGIGDGAVENVRGASSELPDATIRVVPEPHTVYVAIFSLAALNCRNLRSSHWMRTAY
jgi:hypothetical protein